MSKESVATKWDAALYAERVGHPAERPDIGGNYYDAVEYYAPGRRGLMRFMARQANIYSLNDVYGVRGSREKAKKADLERVHIAVGRMVENVDFAVRLYAGHNPAGWLSPEHFVLHSRAQTYNVGAGDIGVYVNPRARYAAIETPDVAYLFQQRELKGEPGAYTEMDVKLDGQDLPLAGMPMTMVREHAGVIVGALTLARDNVFRTLKPQI